jgi:hypothetical protein
LKVIRAAYCETWHIIWFFAVKETGRNSFSFLFEFSHRTHRGVQKGENWGEALPSLLIFLAFALAINAKFSFLRNLICNFKTLSHDYNLYSLGKIL